ncbi:MazG-like family protein [Staphylococcus pseudoxylosus]|uniref:MazG-like family protein n=1 Tax=Staphylococcus pseudoxylosus TaxID=2282419 RepID=UPI002DB7AA4C|nr:MazG-like family protein [Staphylococcus pseudoxylosus]MEB7753300.1 MazG-like family protein [Staphylococcus pseudoxylosus]
MIKLAEKLNKKYGTKATVIGRRTKMSNNLIELTQKIEQWAEDRNLHTADPIKQYDKLIEEFGELMKGINKQDIDMIKDSIGDMYVVLVIMSKQTGSSVVDLLKDGRMDTLRPKHSTFSYVDCLFSLSESVTLREYEIIHDVEDIKRELAKTCGEYYLDFTDCVALAYNEIKDRKGKMIDGKFVKEADL